MNYYQILGLKTNAKSEEIKNSYNSLVAKYEIKRENTTKLNIEKILETIDTAYETLSDEQKRAVYDAKLNSNPISNKLFCLLLFVCYLIVTFLIVFMAQTAGIKKEVEKIQVTLPIELEDRILTKAELNNGTIEYSYNLKRYQDSYLFKREKEEEIKSQIKCQNSNWSISQIRTNHNYYTPDGKLLTSITVNSKGCIE